MLEQNCGQHTFGLAICRRDASIVSPGGSAADLQNPARTRRCAGGFRRTRYRAKGQLGPQSRQSLGQPRGEWGRIEVGLGWKAGGCHTSQRGGDTLSVGHLRANHKRGTAMRGPVDRRHVFCGVMYRKETSRERALLPRTIQLFALGAHGFAGAVPLSRLCRSRTRVVHTRGRARCIFIFGTAVPM